jgi:hypothetical protein
MRLVDIARAGATDVQFLKADDVRLMFCDHADDARQVELAVDADATVHIIGQQTGHEVLEAGRAGASPYHRECDTMAAPGRSRVRSGPAGP